MATLAHLDWIVDCIIVIMHMNVLLYHTDLINWIHIIISTVILIAYHKLHNTFPIILLTSICTSLTFCKQFKGKSYLIKKHHCTVDKHSSDQQFHKSNMITMDEPIFFFTYFSFWQFFSFQSIFLNILLEIYVFCFMIISIYVATCRD